MRWTIGAFAMLFALPADAASGRPILFDPVSLNIGVGCQWQAQCMSRQRTAMASALTYVAKKKPSQNLVHLCNRNASRGGGRVDWVGYDHCIRNPRLKQRLR
jgi:hypothetical protein